MILSRCLETARADRSPAAAAGQRYALFIYSTCCFGLHSRQLVSIYHLWNYERMKEPRPRLIIAYCRTNQMNSPVRRPRKHPSASAMCSLALDQLARKNAEATQREASRGVVQEVEKAF